MLADVELPDRRMTVLDLRGVELALTSSSYVEFIDLLGVTHMLSTSDSGSNALQAFILFWSVSSNLYTLARMRVAAFSASSMMDSQTLPLDAECSYSVNQTIV